MNNQDYKIVSLMCMLILSIAALCIGLAANGLMFIKYLVYSDPITYLPIVFLMLAIYSTTAIFTYLGELVSIKKDG